MVPPVDDLNRREFLGAAGAAAITGPAAGGDKQNKVDRPRSLPPARPDQPKRRLAVITTIYHYLSHSYHICGRFLHGYLRGNAMHYPDWQIAGMHVEQVRKNDLSQVLSKDFKFPLFKT